MFYLKGDDLSGMRFNVESHFSAEEKRNFSLIDILSNWM